MPRSKPSGNLFGKRLRESRLRAGIPQDRLGTLIGIDEGSSSARMSRYETGIHQPPVSVAAKLAQALGVPLAYFYCADDQLAGFIRDIALLDDGKRQHLRERLNELLRSESER